ncbi:hypothetical protein M0804_003712 [Polistes exclamans]|nr:hypothetical protein M0804_003712 [Polistes exclamans]
MAKKNWHVRHCSHCLRPGIVNIAGGGLGPRPVMLTMPGHQALLTLPNPQTFLCHFMNFCKLIYNSN